MKAEEQPIVRIRVRDADGRPQILRVRRSIAGELMAASRGGEQIRVAVDEDGRVSGIIRENRNASLQQRLRRFRLEVDPPAHRVHIPPEWREIIAKYGDPDIGRGTRLLLHGPEGTGKDTLQRLIIGACRSHWGSDQTVVLKLHAEHDDRYVNAQESKVRELGIIIGPLKTAGFGVILVMPEMGSLFARGDYTATYELQFQATLCDMIDGLGCESQKPDLILASCNYTSEIPPPVLSRFLKICIGFSEEFAHGLLTSHWPASLPLNGTPGPELIRVVLEKCYREQMAMATLASRKKKALKAPDLTSFNARFIADFCAELGRRTAIRLREQATFAVDEGFVIAVLADHLAAALHPASEAAGTSAIRKFLVRGHDPLDPIVSVEPTLEWCRESQFLAS